jgi:hypothetical protein
MNDDEREIVPNNKGQLKSTICIIGMFVLAGIFIFFLPNISKIIQDRKLKDSSAIYENTNENEESDEKQNFKKEGEIKQKKIGIEKEINQLQTNNYILLKKVYTTKYIDFLPDADTDEEYHINLIEIKIDGNQIKQINNELAELYKISVDFISLKKKQTSILDYQTTLFNNILSLTLKYRPIYIDSELGGFSYIVYNIDINKKEKITNNELLKKYNVKYDQIKEIVLTEIKEKIEELDELSSQGKNDEINKYTEEFNSIDIEKLAVYINGNNNLEIAYPYEDPESSYDMIIIKELK